MPPLPNLVKAVHLSAWNTPSWIEEPLAAPHALTPNQCHTIVQEDLSPPLLSLRASGLQNTNSPEGNYIDLYEKNNCRNWKSRVKHSGFCINIPPGGFRSVRYIPPSSPSRNNDTAVSPLDFLKRRRLCADPCSRKLNSQRMRRLQ